MLFCSCQPRILAATENCSHFFRVRWSPSASKPIWINASHPPPCSDSSLYCKCMSGTGTQAIRIRHPLCTERSSVRTEPALLRFKARSLIQGTGLCAPTVMDQHIGWWASIRPLFQCIEHRFCAQSASNTPTHDVLCINDNYKRHIGPTSQG